MEEQALAAPLYCAFTVCQTFCTVTVESFIENVRNNNQRFSASSSGVGPIDLLIAVAVLLAALMVQSYAAYVLSIRKKSTVTLIITEVLAWTMVFLAWFMPTSPLKFFYGLLFFAAGLSIHSRVCAYLQEKKRLTPEEITAQGSFSDRFFHELMNTFYFNLLQRIHSFRQCRPPPISRLLYGGVIVVLMDICTYIIREWIPNPANVTPANQSLIAAIVGGVWALFSMDLFYLMGVSQFDLFGAPLPLEMKHRHPLLSESITEFWGVRWNPIIGKLLQDSFYKPLRRIGASRAACVVACFTGSAVLHAVPQYISTQSLSDCAMMFAFFFLQGVCLLVEIVTKRALGFVGVRTPTAQQLVSPKAAKSGAKASKTTKKGAAAAKDLDSSAQFSETKEPMSPSAGATQPLSAVAEKHDEATAFAVRCKSAPYQFPAELVLVCFIISATYVILESLPGAETQWTDLQRQRWVGGTVACGIGAVSMFLIVRHHIRNSARGVPHTEHEQEQEPEHALELSAAAAAADASDAEGTTKQKMEQSAEQQQNTERTDTKAGRTMTGHKAALAHKDRRRAVLCLTAYETLLSLASWSWAVISMVCLLPLFSVPVLHAVEPLYRRSFFVGPLIRALEDVLLPKLQQCAY